MSRYLFCLYCHCEIGLLVRFVARQFSIDEADIGFGDNDGSGEVGVNVWHFDTPFYTKLWVSLSSRANKQFRPLNFAGALAQEFETAVVGDPSDLLPKSLRPPLSDIGWLVMIDSSGDVSLVRQSTGSLRSTEIPVDIKRDGRLQLNVALGRLS